MKYRKPMMEIKRRAEEDIIRTSTIITDPLKPYPGEGEDGEDYLD